MVDQKWEYEQLGERLDAYKRCMPGNIGPKSPDYRDQDHRERQQAKRPGDEMEEWTEIGRRG
ncbi:hypothetical protein BEL01nite_67520 [Bradyrhizobium elkanii]|nr:hypothetical protein BEL01nite_67520 [Bradyrhizobium elkanii]